MPLPVEVSPNLNQTFADPMQVDTPPDENEAIEQEVYTVDNPTLDLEAYASSYNGLARLSRLLYIADHCPSLRIEALEMALSYVQTTYNVSLYKVIHRKLVEAVGNTNLPDISGGLNANIVPLDTSWILTENKKVALKLEKLVTDLKTFESNSINETIRRGHDDLGDHYLDCGELNSALMCYYSARDYCTSGKHVINMYLKIIKVNAYLKNWSHVLTYVNKAEVSPEIIDNKSKEGNQLILTKLRCAAGLAKLGSRKYKSAAENFLQASFVHCDFPELLSPNNVALYGGLLALASFDRKELLENVISSSSFKLFLELEPQLRDIISRFYESKYASCLKMLDDMEDNLLLDMYLAPHVNTLYSQIRNRGLIQYFSTYLSVDMNKMAQSFNTTVKGLEDELIQLILDNQIQARIDSHNKILYAKDVDQRSLVYEKALQMGKEYRRRTTQLILRYAMMRHQIQNKKNEISKKRKLLQSCSNETEFYDLYVKEVKSSSTNLASEDELLEPLNLYIDKN